jgi:hypothetical protein
MHDFEELKRLCWVNFENIARFEIQKFVSLPLLGKQGIRQHFQKVSSREIVQSTDNWHKNKVGLKKNQNIEPNVMPSLYMSYQVLGKLGTRQCFQKVSSREIAQSTEKGHKNVDAYIMQVRVRLSCMPS